MGKTPRRRRWRRWLVVLVVMMALAWFCRSVLLGPMVARIIAQELGLALNGAATVRKASGGWLNYIQLDGVVAQGSPLGPVPLVAARKIKATYGHELLFGELAALRSLVVDGFEIELDLRTSQRASTASEDAWPVFLRDIPQPFPWLDVRGNMQIQLPQDNHITVENLHVTSEADTLALRVPAIRINDTVSLPMVIELTRVERERLHLVRPFAIGDLSVLSLVIALGQGAQRIEANLTVGKGSLVVNVTPKEIHVIADHVDLAAIPSNILTLLPSELGAISGTVSADVTIIFGQQGWNVVGSVRLHDVILAGVGPVQLSSQLQMTATQMHLPQLRITGPASGEVVIDGFALDLREKKPIGGKITVQLPEVNAWWPTFLSPLPAPLRAQAELQVTGDTLKINRAEIIGGGATVQLAGSIAANPLRIEAADLNVIGDLAHVRTWVPSAPVLNGVAVVRVQGNVPLTSVLHTWLAAPLQIDLMANRIDFPRFGVDRVHIKAKTEAGGVRVEDALLAIFGATISTTGYVRQQDNNWLATIEGAQIAYPRLTAKLVQPAAMTLGPLGISLSQFKIESPSGSVAGTIQMNETDGAITLTGTNIDLKALGYEAYDGNLELDIDLKGPWSKPQGKVRVQAPLLTIAGTAIDVQLDVHQNADGITFNRGDIMATGLGHLHASGTMPFIIGDTGVTSVALSAQPGRLDIAVPNLERWFPQRLLGGDVKMFIHIGSVTDPASVMASMQMSDVRLIDVGKQTPGRKISPPAVVAGTVTFNGDKSGLKAQAEFSQGDRIVLTALAESRSPILFQALYDGSWRKRMWQAHGAITGIDVAQLAGAIPGVLHLAGKITGDWSAQGNFETPTWNGALRIDGVEAKIANDVPTLSAGQARLSLDGNILRLDSLGVDLGGSPVTAQGHLVLGQMPQVQLGISGRHALLIQRHDARVRANLDLVLQGPLDQLTLLGKAHVTNALFNPDLSIFSGGRAGASDGRLVLFELEDPLLSVLRFDVAVTSSIDPKDEGVRIAADLVRVRCDLDFHLGGTGATPELIGRIIAREGRVFLPFSTLRITQGEILFPPADPFQPRINVAAHAQVRRYTVQLQVSGLLSDPQILASGDELDQRDALLLLTTGSTSAELTQDNGQRAALGRVGGWLGLEAWRLIEGPENPDSGPGLFDRVTLDMGRQVSDSGLDTIEAEVELTPIEQRPGVFLYGERDRWDDYNLGLILRFSWGGDE